MKKSIFKLSMMGNPHLVKFLNFYTLILIQM